MKRKRRSQDTAARALRALGIGEGPVHVELRVNEGGAWVIDVAARSIGGRCSRALRFEGDASLEGLILGRALGREAPAAGRVEGASGVMMIPIPGAGILRGVEGKEEALAVEGVEEVEVTIHPGGRVLPLPEGDRYLGFIFARGRRPKKWRRPCARRWTAFGSASSRSDSRRGYFFDSV